MSPSNVPSTRGWVDVTDHWQPEAPTVRPTGVSQQLRAVDIKYDVACGEEDCGAHYVQGRFKPSVCGLCGSSFIATREHVDES